MAAGITVVEASAGTGKTHEVTSLAVESIAGGLPVEALLLVTFTRAATGELRDRVWQRLVDTEAALAAFLDAGTVADEALARRLCDGEREEVEARHRRVRDVVAEFDAATIATIHGFCEQVLGRIGFVGDVERDVDFIDDPRLLTDQVVDDLLVQRFHRTVAFSFPRAEAREIAREVIANPHARIVPGPGCEDRAAAMRARFAAAARERLARRKRELRVIGYDDLLTRVEDALSGPNGEVVRRRLHEQFQLVVVDEFQDTDVVQWNILRDAFGSPDTGTSLVLVGDPKQAIYAFRGADVHAYLAARELAGPGRMRTLTTNWRSDAGLLRGLDAVFGTRSGTVTLGHSDIAYRVTRAADHHADPRLRGDRRAVPVRVRHVRRDVADAVLTPRSGDLQVNWARAFVAHDLATDIVYRLGSGSRSTIIDREPDGTERARPIEPGDIAVLVQRHADADLVQGALAEVGVPTVVGGAGSVFDTAAAHDWLTLLEAVEQPAATTRVRSAALSPFFGWDAEAVASRGDDAWDEVHGRLHEWRRVLIGRGVASLFDRVQASSGLPARLLGVLGGERTLTDLRHIAELLHEHGTAHDTAPPTLIAWLRERIRSATRERDLEHVSRRLETDAHAVQIWTVHRSKGQEFPIVYAPFLWWARHLRPEATTPYFHDPATGDRCIDVGGDWAGQHDSFGRHVAEQRGEELRLAYVALTRARHQVVLWWASTHGAWESPLGSLLFAPHADPGELVTTPDDERARTILDVVAQDSDDKVVIETASGGDDVRWDPTPDHVPVLDVRRFDRGLDDTWRRTSYSALTAAAYEVHAGGYAPEHDDRGLEDERLPDEPVVASTEDAARDLEQRLRRTPSVFGELGGGARFGTLVHAVLEEVDFTTPDLAGALRATLSARGRSAREELDVDRIVAGLVAAIETPLGPMVDDLRLRDLARADRVDELHFELPLVGGDEPTGALTVDAIADVVAGTVAGDDPLHGYDGHLRAPVLDQSVRGFLSGSIDVVLRTGDRYVVVDHKSNWLGVEGEELSAWHYRPEALREAMIRAHYPLQAMLYATALHRYLRWRQPGYDPDVHLGGVLYLFLRGMTGADVPRVEGRPCGVFAWRPPVTLVTGLSDVLDRGEPATGTVGATR